MVSIREMLSRLNSAGVEYVVIGGVAARAQGSTLLTDDLDVCCPMTVANMANLIAAIGDLEPKFRLHPKQPLLPLNAESLSQFRNLILQTRLGKFDVLAEVTGLGQYDEVARNAVTMDVFGHPTRVLGLDALIAVKKASGREKDLLGLKHLQAVKRHLDERKD
jgi:predicted nucleotidyltransferase